MQADVLVVEDLFDTLKGTVKQLEINGARISRAATVRDAKEALQRRQYALILLDWRLPTDVPEAVHQNAGALVLESLRNNPSGMNATTPVLIVTAQNTAVPQAYEGQPNPVKVLSKLRPDQIFEDALAILGISPE